MDKVLKDIVNDIFNDYKAMEEEVEKSKASRSQTEKDKHDFKTALRYAEDELDKLHSAFQDFHKEISGLEIAKVIQQDLEATAKKCEFLEAVIKGKFKTGDGSKEAKEEYERLQEMRATILAKVHDYYENDMPF